MTNAGRRLSRSDDDEHSAGPFSDDSLEPDRLVYVGGAPCPFCGQPEHSGLCS